MNIGFLLCVVLGVPFLIIGVLFAIFKEKAAIFVSGCNSLSKEEQALYDKACISRDIRNQYFTWSVIMFIGAVLSKKIVESYELDVVGNEIYITE